MQIDKVKLKSFKKIYNSKNFDYYVTENDDYNMKKFGLTKKEYFTLVKVHKFCNLFGRSLKNINDILTSEYVVKNYIN